MKNITAYIQRLLVFIIVLMISNSIWAQASFNNSEDLLETAEDLFEEADYIKAFPLYSQLLSLDRDNPDLQYKFGVCLLYSDRSDTYEPIRYLNKALNHISTPDIYYHLGFAHHINYNFPAAISFYQEYLNKAGRKKNPSFDTQRQIEMCRNGMQMMRSVKDLFVMEKSEVDREEFFRSYDLQEFNGKMIKKPEIFITREDEKYKTNDFIYFNSESPVVLISGYSPANRDQRDLFKIGKNDIGEWQKAIPLPDNINTPYDENFPVLMPDGRTLYFCSKGHNTMGGYDIFKSEYNEFTETWSDPVNINFPFNTPVDDILFVPDGVESTAWFASVRNSVDEKIMVYRVGIVKRPGGSEDLAAIFARNEKLSNEDLRLIKERAQLDVNISEEEFEEIPVEEEDLISLTEIKNQESLAALDESLEKKQAEQQLVDSAKSLVSHFENTIEALKKLRNRADEAATERTQESYLLKEEVKKEMEMAASIKEVEGLKRILEISNAKLLRAEKLDFEAREIRAEEQKIKTAIDTQNKEFAQFNTSYGDAELAILTGDLTEAEAIVNSMKNHLKSMPKAEDFKSFKSADKQDFAAFDYPADLQAEGSFKAFELDLSGMNPSVKSLKPDYGEYVAAFVAINETQSQDLSVAAEELNEKDQLNSYASVLNEVRASMDIQINETDRNIQEIKASYDELPEDEKSAKIKQLNQLESDNQQKRSQRNWLVAQEEKIQNQINNSNASNASVNQSSIEEIKEVFDLEKKFFNPGVVLSAGLPQTSYSIGSDGELIEETQAPDLIASSDIDYSRNQQLLRNQSTRILEELNDEQKMDLAKKQNLEKEIRQLTQESENAFQESVNYVESAQQANRRTKKDQLANANDQISQAVNLFALSEHKAQELKTLNSRIEKREDIINQASGELENFIRALANSNEEEVKLAYQNLEESYQNNQVLKKYSPQYTSQDVLGIDESLVSKGVFQIDNAGEIQNQITTSSSVWSSYDSFKEAISVNKKAEVAEESILALENEDSVPVAASNDLIEMEDIDFSPSNAGLIEIQSLQILAASRLSKKENDFLLPKLDQKIKELESDLNQTFVAANQLIEAAKQQTGNERENTVREANKKFNESITLNGQLTKYQELKKEVSISSGNQEVLIDRMEADYQNIQNAIAENDFVEVENIYSNINRTYGNNVAFNDFSNEVDYKSAQFIQNQEALNSNIAFYQLTSEGELVKTVGSSNDWNSLDDFLLESEKPDSQQFVMAPNVNLNSRQTEFTEIFETNIPAGSSITLNSENIPSNLTSSNNSLVKNTILQYQDIENKVNEQIAKRNQLNQYYQSQLKKSEDLEQEALFIMNRSSINRNDLEKANDLAFESKKELYKASVAASILRQYDEQIAVQTAFMEKTLETAEEMNRLIKQGEQDEALLLNVQLQREIANRSLSNIDDSAYNPAVNELFVSIPEEITSAANKEFVVVDGQIQRSNLPELNQFLYQQSYKSKSDLSTNNLIAVQESNLFASNQHAVNESQALINTESVQLPNTGNIINPIDGSTTSEPIKLSSVNPQSFQSKEDFRTALAQLNAYSQNHLIEIDQTVAALTQLAEQKLNKSNELLLESESSTAQKKQMLEDSSKTYLYQAMAVKAIVEDYYEYVDEERKKQDQITQASFSIESKLNQDDINGAKRDFESLQANTGDFNVSSRQMLAQMESDRTIAKSLVQNRMDSAYTASQDFANEAVKLLSEAEEERKTAEGKRNAFKRREYLKAAEDKELEATRLQNQSEKALSYGNQLYQEKAMLASLGNLLDDMEQLPVNAVNNQLLVENQEVLFENIENRREEVFEGQFNTTVNTEQQTTANNKPPLAVADDLHVYQRENFKAEMITEELDLLKREIALLVRSKDQSLNERESYIIDKKIDLLRQKADSLEYQANLAFAFANSVLETLSESDQQAAKESGRDFDSYLSELKGKIELLLSEASSLKQRAQRTNNVGLREELFEEAREKEEVAMYLVLEEFEVIAQKNKTRYRRNQLILEQLLMQNASPEERELMRNIFAQIDDYFSQAEQKRQKANDPNLSFSMKKILLQDAYSLEMKALDLQQQAKRMIEEHDRESMMVYQPQDENTNMAQNNNESTEEEIANYGVESIVNQAETTQVETNIPTKNALAERDVAFVNNEMEEGIYYRVQFTALKELKKSNDFPGISEVLAERVAGTDFIRYYSGQFQDLSNAIIRRNSIRASGYKDAFIKSWNNGEVVNLLSLNNAAESSSQNTITSSSAETQVGNVDFSATNITSLQGVYYTVQVGVFNRPRTSAMLFGIAPLYHKRMTNGYWVYYSGIFKSIADAEIKKQDVRAKGVGDAFIVAFSNGEQVNLAEARIQISRGEQSPSDEAIVILEDASTQINQEWNISQSNTVSGNNNSSEALVYKVQVGVYSNPINLSWISSQLDENNTVDSYQNDSGKYVYTIGNFTNESDARALLKEVSDLVSDAFLVGFQDGQKKYIR